ncbi:MAG: hypothetical protein ABL864_08170 [Terricaulis sp.]
MTSLDTPPSSTYALRLHARGQLLPVVLECWNEAPGAPEQVMLQLNGANLTVAARHLQGYFRALCDLRARLEKDGLFLECYGASKNVYPSPMMESMGYGERAYRLTLGKHATKLDVVGIFESGPDVTPTTVGAQIEYYETWLKSLR